MISKFSSVLSLKKSDFQFHRENYALNPFLVNSDTFSISTFKSKLQYYRDRDY